MLKILNRQRLAGVAEIDDIASRPRRRDRSHFIGRKLALGQDVEHLAADIARRANPSYASSHGSFLLNANGRCFPFEESQPTENSCVPLSGGRSDRPRDREVCVSTGSTAMSAYNNQNKKP